MPVILDQIVSATRRRVAKAKHYTDVRALEHQAQKHQPRGFAQALRQAAQNGFGIIAELKKASPSRGLIRRDFHPDALARELAAAGATALSVLTDEEFFQGSLGYLAEASAAVMTPLLRKDFMIDEFQIVEARANCADAILLIVAALSDQELGALHSRAKEFGLDVLCEVHDAVELDRAIAAGCEIIGVNSRDLRTFHVDLNTAFELGSKIPANVVRVAESGIGTVDDIARLRAAGFEAFLIGESLMKVEHPGEMLKRLIVSAELAQKVAAQ
ncbi:MAG TPA: indole-3-glycerol phosphate synthase TrpC [Terriglobales bacterium]|nr:indole-3-glycerol phosphate synthase TrpC [Terriglobales bacterium]